MLLLRISMVFNYSLHLLTPLILHWFLLTFNVSTPEKSITHTFFASFHFDIKFISGLKTVIH